LDKNFKDGLILIFT